MRVPVLDAVSGPQRRVDNARHVIEVIELKKRGS
jgi:hypothetical protein